MDGEFGLGVHGGRGPGADRVSALGLDYSAGHPSPAAITRAGYSFVCRYLSSVGNPKDITASECAELRAAGVDVALVYETTADRATAGHDAGAADAHNAIVEADSVGLSGWPIYFAVDEDLPDYAPDSTDPVAKLGRVALYLYGVASVIGLARTGVYGGYWTVSRALDAGLVTYAWQTGAWSGTNVDPRIHLYQRIGGVKVGGVDCDVNEARRVHFGQQPPNAVRVGGNNVATFIKNMDVPGLYATQDGPMVSGIAEATGQATLTAWPGASCEIGLSGTEFADRVAKSQLLEGLLPAIRALHADIVQALAAAPAQSAPVATGSLTVEQLTAAVAAGVRQGLEGVTESTVLHQPAPGTGTGTTTA